MARDGARMVVKSRREFENEIVENPLGFGERWKEWLVWLVGRKRNPPDPHSVRLRSTTQLPLRRGGRRAS